MTHVGKHARTCVRTHIRTIVQACVKAHMHTQRSWVSTVHVLAQACCAPVAVSPLRTKKKRTQITSTVFKTRCQGINLLQQLGRTCTHQNTEATQHRASCSNFLPSSHILVESCCRNAVWALILARMCATTLVKNAPLHVWMYAALTIVSEATKTSYSIFLW